MQKLPESSPLSSIGDLDRRSRMGAKKHPPPSTSRSFSSQAGIFTPLSGRHGFGTQSYLSITYRVTNDDEDQVGQVFLGSFVGAL